MKFQLPQPLIYFLLKFWRSLYRKREPLTRFLLCLLISQLTLQRDEHFSHDRRLQLRGNQTPSQDIVVLSLSPQDFSNYTLRSLRTSSQIKEFADLSDSIYWNKENWALILKKVLDQNPKAVVVSLFFDAYFAPQNFSTQDKLIFFHPKVFWPSESLSKSLTTEEDGSFRRIHHKNEIALPLELFTEKTFPRTQVPLPINFRGGSEVYSHYRVNDLIQNQIPLEAFTNKIVFVGAESHPLYVTPMGPHNRSEILAQITDNLLHNRWVIRASDIWYSLFLLLVIGLTIYVIFNYPQTVALFVLLWVGILISSLSVWIFDTHSIWIPIFSPLVAIIVTWVVFIGYQADQTEKLNWKLREEQKYFHELEQLKNNFVSLISHDLKTPIAKIQAVVDRLLTQKNSLQTQEDSLHSDLLRLRSYSDELNRYIQSILSLLRVESKDFHLNKEICDINELIDEAIDALKPLASYKSQSLFKKQEPLFTIEADPVLIKEVIINVIENAIKYTPEGGIIWIESFESDNEVHVKIKDNGSGIPPEELQKLWQKFTRGKDQEMKTKGTGLGLYLVKYFVELHGGQVFLESQVHVGTTLHFTLPIEGEA